MSTDEGQGAAEIAALLRRFEDSGGRESSNFQMFAAELADALGALRPDPAEPRNAHDDYVFERAVKDPLSGTTRRIDLYRRGCFVMEGKQSAPGQPDDENQPRLFAQSEGVKKGHAERGTRAWDRVMRAAFNQARGYAGMLPAGHPNPPFVVVVDVGYTIDLYADFSGQGRYSPFPDRRRYRIGLRDDAPGTERLTDPAVQDRLRAVFTDPHALDPARESARVTQDIARRLAIVARSLEEKKRDGAPVHDPQAVATFLMRCLFCMFAEDVGLLPDHSFQKLLESKVLDAARFAPAVEAYWRSMDEGAFDGFAGETFRRFNGQLFSRATALPLDSDQVAELAKAAGRDWREVEPAIFGTLLEQALDPWERGHLGAHFTPRAYVERLVNPTVIEPLEADWENAQVEAAALERAGNHDGALAALERFHHQLCTTRVLDPACGTGNFLYVALELMKRLEGDVLNALESYEEGQAALALDTETVSPRQFLGLELNPRAVPIAELVLWLGYLQWQLRNGGVEAITEPVLNNLRDRTIRHQDALLVWNKRELLRDDTGRPVTRWDGVTKKTDQATGELVPDTSARTNLYEYEGSAVTPWPKADFIVGNPPFIGNKRMRLRLGDDYVRVLRQVYADVPDSVDFVMYWWARCAGLVERGELRRFGLVTTSKLYQTFNRRVVSSFLSAPKIGSLRFCVRDHHWLDKEEDTTAAVRAALTVGGAGATDGMLYEIVEEGKSLEDVPSKIGRITAMLRIGADLASTQPLLANAGLAHQGMTPSGAGFRLTEKELRGLGHDPSSLPPHIRRYLIGRDLTQRPETRYIIDFFGMTKEEARRIDSAAYQRIVTLVKPHRDEDKRDKYRDEFWLFAEARSKFRGASKNLSSLVATCRTSRHRFFVDYNAVALPDTEIVAIAAPSYLAGLTLS